MDNQKYVVWIGIAGIVLIAWLVLSGKQTPADVIAASVPTSTGSGTTVFPGLPNNYRGNDATPNYTPMPAISLGDNNVAGNTYNITGPIIGGTDISRGGSQPGNTYLTYNSPGNRVAYGQWPGPQSSGADSGDNCGCGGASDTCGGNQRQPDGAGNSLALDAVNQLANTNPDLWAAMMTNMVTTGLIQ